GCDPATLERPITLAEVGEKAQCLRLPKKARYPTVRRIDCQDDSRRPLCRAQGRAGALGFAEDSEATSARYPGPMAYRTMTCRSGTGNQEDDSLRTWRNGT